MLAAEFFAGIGLVRLALEPAGFKVAVSNDIEAAKKEMYATHFGVTEGHQYMLGDIANVKGEQMPDGLAVAWASFPCTDLSLAGSRRGLAGSESSTFFEWIRILEEMGDDGRPRVVAAENVVGLATSHGGDDLRTAVRELNELGYSVDVVTLDARRFVPQSRSRLFLIGSLEQVAPAVNPDPVLRPEWLQFVFDDPDLVTHQAALPTPPPLLTRGFTALADRVPPGDLWWDEKRTKAFLDSLSPMQAERLSKLKSSRTTQYRTAYRRTRGGKPTWEIRADDIAGCLRTARGGSSKQAVVRVGRSSVQVRWMTPHEYAALMGAPDYNLTGLRGLQVMFGFGDAVCVPAVAWLAKHYLAPLAKGDMRPDVGSAAAHVARAVGA